MNILQYTLTLNDQMSSTLRKVGVSTRCASDDMKSLQKVSASAFKVVAGVAIFAADGIGILSKKMMDATNIYESIKKSEDQFVAILRKKIEATQMDINAISDLMVAQQKMGIIHVDTQRVAAKELASFIHKKEGIMSLLPLMNDLTVSQYGINATEQQAIAIASSLGMAVNGNVQSLEKYGINLSDVQQKLMCNGSETQKVNLLTQLLSSSVGGMNKELASTPDGKWKQLENEAADLEYRFGKVGSLASNMLFPLKEEIIAIGNQVASFFEKHSRQIQTIFSVISKLVISALDAIIEVISTLKSAISGIISFIANNWQIFAALAIAIGIVATSIGIITLATIAYTSVTKILTFFKGIETAAWWANNAAMLANPVTWIVIGIVALIALIAFLIIKIDGWGDTWDNVIKLCTLVFDSFKANLQLKWLQIQDFFMNGLETIEKGWYKLQSLWNEDAANAGLAKLESQRNERAKEIADVKGKIADINNQISNMDVIQLKVNDTSFSDVANGIKNKLGISSPGIPGTDMTTGGVGGSGGIGGSGGKAGKDTANSIATGGSKTTHIYVTVSEMGNNMKIYVNDLKEGAENIRDIVLDQLTRALTMAQGQI